jgi:hypothetical protein
MADRRSFLGAVSGVAASVLLAAPAEAQSKPPSAAPPTSPQPSPSASAKPPSALAATTAAAMRRFDPALSESDVTTIASAIDANRSGAEQLNPRKATALKNADEPVTRFSAGVPR